jgi:hypothetical protein
VTLCTNGLKIFLRLKSSGAWEAEMLLLGVYISLEYCLPLSTEVENKYYL